MSKKKSQVGICGANVPKERGDLEHEYPACGLKAERDFVVANVGMQHRLGDVSEQMKQLQAGLKKEPADKGRVLRGIKGRKQCTFSIDSSIKPCRSECADFNVGFWMTKITEGGGGEEGNAPTEPDVQSGKDNALLHHPPLRTGLAIFTASGSSLSKPGFNSGQHFRLFHGIAMDLPVAVYVQQY